MDEAQETIMTEDELRYELAGVHGDIQDAVNNIENLMATAIEIGVTGDLSDWGRGLGELAHELDVWAARIEHGSWRSIEAADE